MSGVVKAVKKAFKSVVKFVKKALPYIVMAAAVYFTAGLALSAFPATAGFAASMPGFAGGGFAGLGIGAGKVAGTGFFTKAAAGLGMGSLGSSGGLIGGAMAAGTSQATLVGAGINAGAVAAGGAEFAGSAAGAAAGAGASAGAGVATGGGGATMAGAGGMGPVLSTVPLVAPPAAAGMTIGEKLLLASTGTQAVGALMSSKEGAKQNFKGAFYGMDRKGKGGAIMPAVAGVEGQQPALSAAPEQQQVAPTQVGTPTQKPGELFAQGQQFATATPQRAGSKFDIEQPDDLFSPMSNVRYVR